MGYGLNRFHGTVDPNLLCSICGSVLEEAVLTPCGHSFCQLCLDTWLVRPNGGSTCPECRGRVGVHEVRPIHSVRNLINNMDIYCKNTARGCRGVVRLESLNSHLGSCNYEPIGCAGCGITVNRSELASHQMRCEAIAAAIRDDVTSVGASSNLRPRRSFSCCSRGTIMKGHHGLDTDLTNPRSLPCEVTDLACRVATLEMQLKRMKRDLEAADVKNRKIDRELKRAKEELDEKRNQLLDQQLYVEFDPDYEYGYTASTITVLSRLIARFLLKRPTYIDRNRLYNSIKRCYDNYGRSSDGYEHDVHMLIATAHGSNWFTDNQKLSFHCWLQSIARHLQFSPGLTTVS